MGDDQQTFTSDQHNLLIAHYQLVAPLITASFGGTPLVAGFVPDWSTRVMIYEETIAHSPSSIPTIQVPLKHATGTFAVVAENSILWQAHRGAIAFLGWSPTKSDPTRVAFGRILLEPCGLATIAMVKEAAVLIRTLLAKDGLQSIVLLGGEVGLAIWIPFSDAPAYDDVRAHLDALVAKAARAHPTLLTNVRPISERGDRIHLAAGSNAVGRTSALPYSLRALDSLPVVAPIAWDELDSMDPSDVTAAAFATRLEKKGDVFANQVTSIGPQLSTSFTGSASGARPISMYVPLTSDAGPRGRIIRAAIAILDDGKPRNADNLCAEAITRGLIPKTTSRKDVYTELIEYISRAKGHDREPKIVQDPDRRFRRNLPADDWPAPRVPLAKRAPAANADALIAELQRAGAGDDPAAYELAVCAAFAALGMIATHAGGEAAPDGYVDAPLGTLGYRVMLECKRAKTIVQEPDAAEAAKYVEAYRAQYATLIGPAFGDDIQLASELKTHGVAAFTNDDLAQLLNGSADPHELRALFEPGFVSERIEGFLWNREHGERKRLAVVCDIILSSGWSNQQAAARSGDPIDAPHLDEDAAMMLVDDEVLGRQGSQSPCTRPEVRAAFAHLTDIAIGKAVWLDENRAAIVITSI